MAGTLLSGPAGGGKSQEARRLLAAALHPTIVADFQSILSALLLQERDPETGRFPPRLATQAYALATAEYVRRVVMTAAQERGLDIITTNSDGSVERRAELLRLLGPGSTEKVIDPGRAVVSDRLAIDGVLSEQCQEAIDRWYGRL